MLNARERRGGGRAVPVGHLVEPDDEHYSNKLQREIGHGLRRERFYGARGYPEPRQKQGSPYRHRRDNRHD